MGIFGREPRPAVTELNQPSIEELLENDLQQITAAAEKLCATRPYGRAEAEFASQHQGYTAANPLHEQARNDGFALAIARRGSGDLHFSEEEFLYSWTPRNEENLATAATLLLVGYHRAAPEDDDARRRAMNRFFALSKGSEFPPDDVDALKIGPLKALSERTLSTKTGTEQLIRMNEIRRESFAGLGVRIDEKLRQAPASKVIPGVKEEPAPQPEVIITGKAADNYRARSNGRRITYVSTGAVAMVGLGAINGPVAAATETSQQIVLDAMPTAGIIDGSPVARIDMPSSLFGGSISVSKSSKASGAESLVVSASNTIQPDEILAPTAPDVAAVPTLSETQLDTSVSSTELPSLSFETSSLTADQTGQSLNIATSPDLSFGKGGSDDLSFADTNLSSNGVIATPAVDRHPAAHKAPAHPPAAHRTPHHRVKHEKKAESHKSGGRYDDLLNSLSRFESGGNYNAYYGHGDNHRIKFTSMSVGEVMDWQRGYLNRGSDSSAIGKYQFLLGTLQSLVSAYDIPHHTKFDKDLQDELAVHLLEKRELGSYLKGHISARQFAHELSKEWASLPRVTGSHPEASYYAGDGLNHSFISVREILHDVRAIKSHGKPQAGASHREKKNRATNISYSSSSGERVPNDAGARAAFYAKDLGINRSDIDIVHGYSGLTHFYINNAGQKKLGLRDQYPYHGQSSPDPWGMYKGQCVSFAAWRVATDDVKGGMPYWGGRGNAHEWDNDARASGILTNKNLKAGAVLGWNTNGSEHSSYGHMSYIEMTRGEGNNKYAVISQYNAGGTEDYSVEIYSPQLAEAQHDQIFVIHFEKGQQGKGVRSHGAGGKSSAHLGPHHSTEHKQHKQKPHKDNGGDKAVPILDTVTPPAPDPVEVSPFAPPTSAVVATPILDTTSYDTADTQTISDTAPASSEIAPDIAPSVDNGNGNGQDSSADTSTDESSPGNSGDHSNGNGNGHDKGNGMVAFLGGFFNR
jgi:surface antigen